MKEDIVDFIRKCLENGEHRQYGDEPVSELEHALQCATLAEAEGADEELIAAALLHDFGRLVAEDGDLSDSIGGEAGCPIHGDHGHLGARSLQGHLSDRVLFCIRNHAEAKRYLCTTEPAYFNQLSSASVATLEKQGGTMGAEERRAFEDSPFSADAVRLRRWDDAGKVSGSHGKPLSYWLEMVERQIRR